MASRFAFFFYAASCWLSLATSASPETVFIEFSQETGRYRVVSSTAGVLGADGSIRGASGHGHIAAANASGADALRTWGVDGLEEILKQAEDNGLRVSAGIWLPHSPKHYEECSNLSADPFWNAELDKYTTAVARFKTSPAVLWWTVGNEMELEVSVLSGSDCVWKRVEWVAKAVNEEDPDHPVGTVLAGVAEPKVRSITKMCPSVQFLGANSYGDDSLRIGVQLRNWSWTKPFAIMEFGPIGHWASPVTEWGAYIEETSSEKVLRYNATCHSCIEDPQCIGAFAFVWGWKWEKTGTWYNLFNEWTQVTEDVAVNCSQCESEVVAALQKCWTGMPRADLPPTIYSISVDGVVLPDMSVTTPRSDAVTLKVNTSQPRGKELIAIWVFTEERVSNAIGGAWEASNPLLTGAWSLNGVKSVDTTAVGLAVDLNTSDLKLGGEYRLYVFVRQDPSSCDGPCQHQEASASLPLYVCDIPQPGSLCYSAVRYAMEIGIHVHPQTYPGVNESSSFEEFQVVLYQKGEGGCVAPCGLRNWCHTSVEGQCYSNVKYAMDHGREENPGLYPWYLTQDSTFEDWQKYFYEEHSGLCPKPCAHVPAAEDSEGTPHSRAPRFLANMPIHLTFILVVLLLVT